MGDVFDFISGEPEQSKQSYSGRSKSYSKALDIGRLNPFDINIGTAGGSFLNQDYNQGALNFTSGIGGQGADVLGSSLGQIQADIKGLQGNANPFLQARIAPFLRARDQASLEATRRGVTGPLKQLVTNPFTSEIANQGALATQETFGAIRSLVNDQTGIGQQLIANELTQLGLTQDEVGKMLAYMATPSQQLGSFSESEYSGSSSSQGPTGGLAGAVGDIGDIFGTIGGAMAGFGGG